MTGIVLKSINNIYSVKVNEGENRGQVYLCRIKGKQLSQAEGEYNPIVAGDILEFFESGTNEGMVTNRKNRTSDFARWNEKKQNNQVVCANMDQVAIVCSVESPPFRPRFIDRAIACVHNVKVIIVLNKCDILLTEDELERFSLYKKLGYETISVSSMTGENLDKLKILLKDKTTAFIGQSGVGKSSLVNSLLRTNQRMKCKLHIFK
ncbi:MAG: GTPase RsgA [Sphaerochaetaceae bacterium]|nr:GTPase RsgA [Sphaerochaetaceae bacterium]